MLSVREASGTDTVYHCIGERYSVDIRGHGFQVFCLSFKTRSYFLSWSSSWWPPLIQPPRAAAGREAAALRTCGGLDTLLTAPTPPPTPWLKSLLLGSRLPDVATDSPSWGKYTFWSLSLGAWLRTGVVLCNRAKPVLVQGCLS